MATIIRDSGKLPDVSASVPGRKSIVLSFPYRDTEPSDETDDFLKFVTNETQLVALRKKFEAYSGPVTNAGGVK